MPPKKIKFKVVKKLPAKPAEKKPVEKKPAEKKKKIKFKVVKKLNPKEEPESLGKRQTGLTKEQMNKLSPLELFGKLPTELKGKVAKSGPLGKRKATSYKYNEIVEPEDDDENNLLLQAEDNAQENLAYMDDLTWIKGVSEKMSDFWLKNHWKVHNTGGPKLSEKKLNRIERIEEKINDNMRSSLEKELKRELKKWKEKNKDKSFTLKEARDSFESFYF